MYWFFKFDIFSICLLVFFNFGSNSCSVILKYQELFFHCCVPPCVNGFLLCVYLHACVCVQGCCSEAEAQQAGRMQTTSQPIQCELPTIPVQIGSHFLKGVSFNESAAENLKLKTVWSQTQLASFILLPLVTRLPLLKTWNCSVRWKKKKKKRIKVSNSVFILCRFQSHQLFLGQ